MLGGTHQNCGGVPPGLLPRGHRQGMLRLLALVGLLLTLPPAGLGNIYLTTQTLSATVGPYASLTVPASVALRSSGTPFSPYTGSLTLNYQVRTRDTGGGSISAQVTSDFAPSGGPSTSMVTYVCTGSTLGTNCSGTQTLSTSSQTPVVTIPAGACTGGGGGCSESDPNNVTLTLAVPDKPSFKTGSYSATITFTISST